MKSVQAVRPKNVCWPPLMLIQPELSRTTTQTGVPARTAAWSSCIVWRKSPSPQTATTCRSGWRELRPDRGRQREAHRREPARCQVGPRQAGHPALLDHALRQARAGHDDGVVARRSLDLADRPGHRHRRRVGAGLDLDLLQPRPLAAGRSPRSRGSSGRPPDRRPGRAPGEGRSAPPGRLRRARPRPGSSCRSRADRCRAGSASTAGSRR